jgi:2-dehydro-3-deoxyphosphogluconate aldolase/(4S)-4-hydroxy-2-oxoglutarate aldolase
MAQFTRIEVAQTMKESGMVPLFFHSDIEVAKKVLKACYDGGARLMEFTNRGDFALEVFTELTKVCSKRTPWDDYGRRLCNRRRGCICLYA